MIYVWYDINKSHACERFVIEVKQECTCSWEVAAGKLHSLKMSLPPAEIALEKKDTG